MNREPQSNPKALDSPRTPSISQEDLQTWKSSLLNLPGDTFLDMIRNFLGPIQTPYDKHSLLTRLIRFLKAPEYFEALWLIMTEDEQLVINGVFHLGPITAPALVEFLDPEGHRTETLLAISGLVERMVLYFDDRSCLRVNPILAEQLWNTLGGITQLFPSIPRIQKAAVSIPWLNDVSIQAFYLVLRDHPMSLLQSRTLSKKLLQHIQKKCPSFLATFPRIEWLAQTTAMLGLLLCADEESFDLQLIEDRWTQIFQLPSWDRAIYFWAGVISSSLEIKEQLPDQSDDPGTSKPDLIMITLEDLDYFALEATRGIASLLNDFLTCLNQDRWYPRESLIRILNSLGPDENQPYHTILRGLIFLDVLIPGPQDSWGLNPALAHLSKAYTLMDPPASGCVVQPNGVVRIQPWVPPGAVLDCIRFGSLELAEFTLDLKFDKHHGFQQFRLGITADDILETLRTLSGNQIPQPFQFLVNQWYLEFTKIIPTRGILLEISQEIQTQLLHNPMISSLGLRELSPGLIFLPCSFFNEAQILGTLKDAGFPLDGLMEPLTTFDPGLEPITALPSNTKYMVQVSRLLANQDIPIPIPVSIEDSGASDEKAKPKQELAEAHRKTLFEHLSTLKLSEDVRRELEFRIQQGTILLTSQLDPKISRPEVTQAGGLDFTGKMNLIQAAMKAKDFLEVIYHITGDPQEIKVLGYPKNVFKEQNTQTLVFHPLKGAQYIHIPVSTIQFIRRLRGLVFRVF